MNGNFENNASYLNFTLPPQKSSSDIFLQDTEFDKCSMYSPLQEQNRECEADAFNQSMIIACDKFTYDRSIFIETVTTSLDLVCQKEYQRRLLSTISMLGFIIGSILGGKCSDRFGRKNTLIGATIVTIPSVMFGGYTSYYVGKHPHLH